MNDKRIIAAMLIEEDDHQKEEIQIVPMIDVMLFLLVFFIIYTINVIPNLVQGLNLPSSSTLIRSDMEEPVRIYIKSDGKIILDKEEVEIIHLESKIKSTPEYEKKNYIIVADKDSRLQTLVDVIDVLKSNGITKVGIAGDKK